jgi:hypothetical protein
MDRTGALHESRGVPLLAGLCPRSRLAPGSVRNLTMMAGRVWGSANPFMETGQYQPQTRSQERGEACEPRVSSPIYLSALGLVSRYCCGVSTTDVPGHLGLFSHTSGSRVFGVDAYGV